MNEFETMRKISCDIMELYDSIIDQQEDTPKNAAILARLAVMEEIALIISAELGAEEG